MKISKIIVLVFSVFLFTSCQSQTKKSIKEAIVKTSYNDIDGAISYYKKLKKEVPNAYNFEDENELNNLGYQLLNDNRIADAIKILELLADEFPNSFNPYDSLGEAYLLQENSKLAIENYKKSLELNPKNENAERAIINIQFRNRNKNKFNKIYKKQQYLDDLDELAKTLTETNPHPYKFMSKDDFWRVVEEKKNLITEKTTYREFIWHCSELTTNINCVHTGLGYFNQESEMLPTSLRFPIETRLIDTKLYITDPLINDLKKRTEILMINGVEIADIIKDIFKHITSQGHIKTKKAIYFNSYSTSYIPYALNFPAAYTITIKGRKKPIQLKQLQSYKPKPRHYPTNLCESKDLCLDYIDDNTAVLTVINSGAYYGNRFSIFKEFMDESFKEINSKNVKNLIVDVRSNSGGPGNTAAYLLRYLYKKPFVYKKLSEGGSNIPHKLLEPFENNFKGNTYFLIDGEGGSTTGHLLAHVKESKLATIIGEELGGNHFCTGGQRIFKLKNTEVFYKVGRYTNITSTDSFDVNRGIMPDHYVVQSIEDFLKDKDVVMEFTMELIKKQ